MAQNHDDDDLAIIDWGEQADTSVDGQAITVKAPAPALEVDTAKFRSLEFATGREAGFSEGVERTLSALTDAMIASGLTPQEARRIVMRVRLAALERG